MTRLTDEELQAFVTHGGVGKVASMACELLDWRAAVDATIKDMQIVKERLAAAELVIEKSKDLVNAYTSAAATNHNVQDLRHLIADYDALKEEPSDD